MQPFNSTFEPQDKYNCRLGWIKNTRGVDASWRSDSRQDSHLWDGNKLYFLDSAAALRSRNTDIQFPCYVKGGSHTLGRVSLWWLTAARQRHELTWLGFNYSSLIMDPAGQNCTECWEDSPPRSLKAPLPLPPSASLPRKTSVKVNKSSWVNCLSLLGYVYEMMRHRNVAWGAHHLLSLLSSSWCCGLPGVHFQVLFDKQSRYNNSVSLNMCISYRFNHRERF